MNKIILVGRLATTPYKNVTTSKVEYSRFTVAVRRKNYSPNGEQITDFIPCVAWRYDAAFVNRFLDKGSLVSIEGTLQSQRFTNSQGQVITSYSVNVESIDSLESKGVSEQRKKQNADNNNQFNMNTLNTDTNPADTQNNVEEFSTASDSEFADLSWE